MGTGASRLKVTRLKQENIRLEAKIERLTDESMKLKAELAEMAKLHSTETKGYGELPNALRGKDAVFNRKDSRECSFLKKGMLSGYLTYFVFPLELENKYL